MRLSLGRLGLSIVVVGIWVDECFIRVVQYMTDQTLSFLFLSLIILIEFFIMIQ